MLVHNGVTYASEALSVAHDDDGSEGKDLWRNSGLSGASGAR